MFYSIARKQNFLRILFFGSILLRKHTRGERSKEMHVRIRGKQNEKILNYINSKHVGA